jgi:uncharacterized protein
MAVTAHRLLLLLLLALALPLQAAPEFPALTGRVVDQAGLLSQQARSELSAMLAEHEKATSNQLVVVTLKSLQGNDIADYGYQLGRHWGIGQEGKNNGVLLIVAPQERKVRIEVGYGLEGTLTDAISHDIIQSVILPQFRQGDYPQGIRNGTAAILNALGGSYEITQSTKTAKGASSEDDEIATMLIVGFFLVNIIGGTLIGRVIVGAIVGTVAGAFAYAFFSSLYVGAAVGVGIFILSLLSSSTTGGRRGYRSHRSGGSFGGGGFSGGGGSFGGGGASGGW